MMRGNKVSRWIIGMFAVLMLTVLCSTTAQAYHDWTVPTGNWTNAANWSQPAKPTSADYVYVRNDGTAVITTVEAASQLHVGGSAGNGTLEIQNSAELASGEARLGEAADRAGTISQSGGLYTNSSAVRIAYTVGSQGTYNLNAGIMTTHGVEVGWRSVGEFCPVLI